MAAADKQHESLNQSFSHKPINKTWWGAAILGALMFLTGAAFTIRETRGDGLLFFVVFYGSLIIGISIWYEYKRRTWIETIPEAIEVFENYFCIDGEPFYYDQMNMLMMTDPEYRGKGRNILDQRGLIFVYDEKVFAYALGACTDARQVWYQELADYLRQKYQKMGVLVYLDDTGRVSTGIFQVRKGIKNGKSYVEKIEEEDKNTIILHTSVIEISIDQKNAK